jgi:hypothetical protein
MKDFFGGVGVFLGVTVGFLGLLWAFQGNDFFLLYRYFAPKYEQVRRETFEQTKSYNQGMIQELQNMQFEYQLASPQQRVALKGIILHRAADYPQDKLPVDLRNFINDLKDTR